MRYFKSIVMFMSIFLVIVSHTLSAAVVINEFCAANVAVIADNFDFDDFSDWIELHNSGSTVENIGGFTLTDELSQPKKWKIPTGTTIPAGGYLLIWADDHDGEPGQQETREWYPWTQKYTLKGYHAVFKLNKAGEEIGLFNTSGTLVDSISFGKQYSDVSMGRGPDGAWVLFDEPTPGTANSTTAKPLGTAVLSGDVTFSVEGGFYPSAQSVSLAAADGSDIYYTTDGSIPYASDKKYSAPIAVNALTTIRARTVTNGKLAGKVITNTYFINNKQHTVMVVALSTDPAFLNDKTMGIWENNMKGREVPVALEFFTPDGKRVVHCNAGVRNGTLTSFDEAQHPLQIALRERYGDPFVEYKFFDKNITKFSRFRLRQGGDVWNTNFIGDAILDPINKNQTAVGIQAFRATVVYVNGEYYGLMNLREQFKEYYFTENLGVDPTKRDEVRSILQPSSGGLLSMIREGWELVAGSWDTYRSLISGVKKGTVSDAKYAQLQQQIDIPSMVDFFSYICFGVAISWGHNQDLWKVPEGKWRWLVTDFDRAWTYSSLMGGVKHNPFNKAAGSSPSIVPGDTLFSKLITNTEFKNFFVQRFAAHLNSTFKSSRCSAIVDSIAQIVAPEMADHAKKWASKGGIKSVSAWQSEISSVKKFMNERPEYCFDILASKPFNASNGRADLSVTLSPSGAQADIFINGVRMSQGLDKLSLFKRIPFTVTVGGKPGWRFVGWEGTPGTDPLSVTLTGDRILTATFIQDANHIQVQSSPEAFVPAITSKLTRANGRSFLSIRMASGGVSDVEVSLYTLCGRKIAEYSGFDNANGASKTRFFPITAAQGVYLCRIHSNCFNEVNMIQIQ